MAGTLSIGKKHRLGHQKSSSGNKWSESGDASTMKSPLAFAIGGTTKATLLSMLLLTLSLSILVQHSSQQPQPGEQAPLHHQKQQQPNDDEDTYQLQPEEEAGAANQPTASGTAASDYVSPQPDHYHLFEHFDDSLKFDSKWIKSKDEKYRGKWLLKSGGPGLPQADLQLLLASKANHHAIATKLDRPFDFKAQKQLNKPLIVQYEVQFREGIDCGGAYLKLLRQPSQELGKLNDKTPYSIMFGPDKCGGDYKLHFIVNYLNPITKQYEEKHWKSNKHNTMMQVFTDKKAHFFRLVLQPNDQFELFVDDTSIATGSLLEDMEPSINPPKEIVDEDDKKPGNWDERARIEDPTAKKPKDWDENAPRTIPDPSAVKPSDWLEGEPLMVAEPDATKPKDWDHEMDGEWAPPLVDNPACKGVSGCGEWTPPMVDNPAYKGKWRPPMIDNPAYKGTWSPRLIPNPQYYHDENPFASLSTIDAVAFELWSMSEMIAFDNILLTDDTETAKFVQRITWQAKKMEADASSPSLVTRLLSYTQQYPWLWAVAVLAIGLPLCLFIAFCCTGKKSRSDSSERIAANKKSDVSYPDSKPSEEVKEGEEAEEAEEAEEEEEEPSRDDVEEDEEEEIEEVDEEEDDDEKEAASGEDSRKVGGDEMKSEEPSKRQTRRSKRH